MTMEIAKVAAAGQRALHSYGKQMSTERRQAREENDTGGHACGDSDGEEERHRGLFFSYHTDNPNSKLLPSTPSGVGSRRLPRSRTRPIASGQVDLQHRHEQPSEAGELCVAGAGWRLWTHVLSSTPILGDKVMGNGGEFERGTAPSERCWWLATSWISDAY
jgi:hypothetical protein